MTWRKSIIFFYMILLPGTAAIITAADDESRKIHPFIESSSYCSRCHLIVETNNINRPSQACDPCCLTCHNKMDRHHKVGMEIKQEAPRGLKLTGTRRVACRTCHNLSGKRYDSKSWQAESLFGSIFSFKSRHKTCYLLIRNNSGQLCRKCH